MGEAFAALEAAGYHVGSAYTAVKDPSRTKFVYRDRLWQGADLVGLGVASFGHVNGVHMQNLDTLGDVRRGDRTGELPLGRAYRPTADERLIREFVLQLKRGSIQAALLPGRVRRGRDVAVPRRHQLARGRGRTWTSARRNASHSPARGCCAWTCSCRASSCRNTGTCDTHDHDLRYRRRIVIGGGPGGSTAAALLAEYGHKVLLLERETFPRYHIGESLIPYTWFTLNRLGLVEWLRAVGEPEEVQRAVRVDHGQGLAAVLFLPDHQARMLA